MAQFVGAKIDWQALVKKTETGIKSAREFQMLWRHLAYRQPLIENIGPEDQPLVGTRTSLIDLYPCLLLSLCEIV